MSQTTYDPEAKRHRAPCPHCDYVVVRAKREAALHALAIHIAYAHEDAPEARPR